MIMETREVMQKGEKSKYLGATVGDQGLYGTEVNERVKLVGLLTQYYGLETSLKNKRKNLQNDGTKCMLHSVWCNVH